jgi:thymidylate synthase (FAD)
MDQVFLYNDSIGYCHTLDHMGSDLTIVNSARVSFDVNHTEMTDRDEKLVRYLYRNKHTSPFEHCSIRFECNVPLFVARQHMRHRTWSFNEVSRRYTNINLEFYTPEEFRPQADTNRQASVHDGELVNPTVETVSGSMHDWIVTASEAVQIHTKKSVRLYNRLLEEGVCREQARMVLPQNMYCKYVATANLHNILKFISLRDKPEAQWEIRRLAQEMSAAVSQLFPVAWDAYTSAPEAKEPEL